MSRHIDTRPDTNPHFVRPFQPQNQDQLPYTSPQGPPPEHLAQNPEPRHGFPEPRHGFLEPRHGFLEPRHGFPEPRHGFPEQVRPEPRQDYTQTQRSHKKQLGRKARPGGQLVSFHQHIEEQKHPQAKHQEIQDKETLPYPQAKHQEIQDKQTRPLVPTGQTPPHDHEQLQQRPWHGTSPGQPSPHSQHRRQHGLLKPPQETSFFAWSTAICCALFWVVVIITGLVVLIIYLVFRPKTPKFDVSSATLNAAYLDMGYLLNADFTILANFTNPNKKVSVDFSYLIIDLYYGTTHIATEYIEPFSAHKRESMFANVHMVVSQVRLGALESQRLKRQMEINRAAFEVKGYFRARANFGKILRYSYWLHSDCKVVFTGPPQGVLVGRKCKTKR